MRVHDIKGPAIGLHIVVVLAQAGKVCRGGRPAIRVVDAVIFLAGRGRAVAAGVAAGTVKSFQVRSHGRGGERVSDGLCVGTDPA